MSWDTLDEFIHTVDHWSSVQEYLEKTNSQEKRYSNAGLVTFKTPVLDGDTLVLPGGSAAHNDSDRVEQYFVTHSEDLYTLRSTGRERGTHWDGPIKSFSHFELAGKYILAALNTDFRRMIGASEIETRWKKRGLAPGWATQEIAPLPENVYRTLQFVKLGPPSMSFVGERYESMWTYPLSETYDELTVTVMAGIPQP